MISMKKGLIGATINPTKLLINLMVRQAGYKPRLNCAGISPTLNLRPMDS
jgi:hypothetical protein